MIMPILKHNNFITHWYSLYVCLTASVYLLKTFLKKIVCIQGHKYIWNSVTSKNSLELYTPQAVSGVKLYDVAIPDSILSCTGAGADNFSINKQHEEDDKTFDADSSDNVDESDEDDEEVHWICSRIFRQNSSFVSMNSFFYRSLGVDLYFNSHPQDYKKFQKIFIILFCSIFHPSLKGLKLIKPN